jgi:hypothetical protein
VAPLVTIAQGWEVVARGPIVVKVRQVAGGNVRELWAEGELEAEVQDLQEAILDADAYPRFMPYFKESRTLELAADGTRVVYARLEPPFIGSRDYVVKVQIRSLVTPDGRGTFSNFWRSMPDRLPRRRSVVRLLVCDGSWDISRTPSGRAQVVYRAAVDPGIRLPAFLSNLANSVGTIDTFRAVEREARRRGEVRRARAASAGAQAEMVGQAR